MARAPGPVAGILSASLEGARSDGALLLGPWRGEGGRCPRRSAGGSRLF